MKRTLIITCILLLFVTSCSNSLKTSGAGKGTQVSLTTPTFTPSPTPTSTPTPQPRARVTIGQQDMLNGDYEAALNQFWNAREQSTDPEVIAAAQLGVGRVLLLQSDYKGAIDQFTWLQDNFSTGETRNTAYFFLAKAYEGLGEYLLAADAYQQYVAAQPGPLDSEILEMSGDALMQANDAASAKAVYLKALDSAITANIDALELKIARASAASGDNADAIDRYLALLDTSTSDYILAQTNFLLGQLYLRLGMNEQAYARFQDNVIRFPAYYDTYSGLVALVEADQPVDDLLRGIVDYFAGQYGLTVTAMDNYMANHPEHDGTPLYYKAESLWNMGDYKSEIAVWDELIAGYPADQYLATAYLEKSSSMWRYFGDYPGAANNLLDFVAIYPDAPEAPKYLNTAAKIFEIGNYLSRAAKTWTRVFTEYPSSELAYPALFQSAIVTYRDQKFSEARLIFHRLLVLATAPSEVAAANFWVAKCYQKENNPEATTYFQQAAKADPTGYYSIRANEILNDQEPFPPPPNQDFSVDLTREKKAADKWMRSTFNLESSVNLDSLDELSSNPLFQRGAEYWKLGMRNEARSEFESLRTELEVDAVNSYRLLNYLVNNGFYQAASLTSRQILDLAGLSQADTLTSAPIYFNHIRFGVFYRDLIVPAARENGIDPLLLFSIIRQESLFDANITSSAGAHGLMQITDATGDYIVTNFGWPQNYTSADLERPVINVRLGAHYLKLLINEYDGSIPPALSSYNAGDGNTVVWKNLAGNDIDLFVEIIRFEETQNYIRYIAENYAIYKTLYTHP